MSQKLIEAYHSKCLQADVLAAVRILRKKSDHNGFRRLKLRVQRRFLDKSEKTIIKSQDPLVRSVVASYREYYRKALMHKGSPRKLEKLLKNEVRMIALAYGIFRAKTQSWEALEKALILEFRRRGYFALFGKVTPFRSLLVWQKEKSHSYRVRLTESVQEVNVVFLDAFVELGWLHFATFGKWYVGGWAKKDALYCVAQAYKYKFNTERFKVSYLTHEAQHFADYKKFSQLQQSDLEYRAKLAELAASNRPKYLLKKFSVEAKNNK